MLAVRARNLILAALVLLVSLEGLSWWTSTLPAPCAISQIGGKQTSPNNSQKDCPTFLVASVIAVGNLNHFIESHDKSIVAVFTVMLAISTIGLWLATVRLWRSTNATLRHAETTAEHQLRAYISVTHGTAWRQGQGRGVRFEFRPNIHNTGQTPAYWVNVSSNIRFLPVADAATYNFSADLPPLDAIGVLTLGRQQERFTSLTLDRRLTKAELRQYKSGTHRIFVFGRVHYITFGRERWTNYCYAIPPWPKRQGALWQTTLRHNESN